MTSFLAALALLLSVDSATDPHLSGDFLWRQAYNAKKAGATMLKIAMFDEVDEATAIMKVLGRCDEAPAQGFWLTLDADGTTIPSDWHLLLSGEINCIFHGDREPTPEIPIELKALP